MGSGKKTSTTPFHSSKTASSATVNFLALPLAVRDKIYKRVLFIPHPLYLFQEPGSRVECFGPDRPSQWLALLYTNRQINREASAALYGVNQFHLVDITEQQVGLLQSFVDCIGPVNAASLSHLCINFPVAESIHGQPGNFKLRDDSLQTLEILQDKCPNLSTLDTLVHSENCGVFKKTDDLLQEALSLIDAHFKSISSLKRIIVRFEVFGGIPSASAKTFMQGLGWIVVSRDGNRR
ncbi:hypothetical protein MPH_13357 [Macrophomina phaseolina MS6]|uniref:Uncharacterized protein n=1 Tax=Macrophomina phaseolina (strain MS6) TaxID=1126212 RepID=K2RYT6_MACPH|nr:hypothetical protein MPH_13357 [Macrophomina phaseolina MS6]